MNTQHMSKCQWLATHVSEYVPEERTFFIIFNPSIIINLQGYCLMYPCAHLLHYNEKRDTLLFLEPFFGEYYIWLFANSLAEGRGVVYCRVGPRYNVPITRSCIL